MSKLSWARFQMHRFKQMGVLSENGGGGWGEISYAAVQNWIPNCFGGRLLARSAWAICMHITFRGGKFYVYFSSPIRYSWHFMLFKCIICMYIYIQIKADFLPFKLKLIYKTSKTKQNFYKIFIWKVHPLLQSSKAKDLGNCRRNGLYFSGNLL